MNAPATTGSQVARIIEKPEIQQIKGRSMTRQGRSSKSGTIRGLKHTVMALAFAVLWCCGAGSLMAQTLVIGDIDTGILNLPTQGPVTFDTLILGNTGSGNGTLNFSAGTLDINHAGGYSGYVTAGNSGIGIINHDNSNGNGVINIRGPQYQGPAGGGSPDPWGGYLFLGRNDGSTGTYTLSDYDNGNTLSLYVQNGIQIGGSNISTLPGGGFSCNTGNCTGSFVQTGGVVTTGQVTIGIGAGTGLYTINSGTLNSFIDLGNSSGNGNAFTQNGGTVNANMFIANGGGSQGTYTLTDGTVNSNWSIAIGMGGTGRFVMNGGTVNSTSVALGVQNVGEFTQTAGDHFAHEVLVGTDVGGKGTYDLQGGTLTIGDGTTDRLVVGHNSDGKFTMSDGTLIIQNQDINTGAFVVGNNAGSNGSFMQLGGDVQGGRSLTIGANGGIGVYGLSNGDPQKPTTLKTGFISLGFNGTGVFIQEAGTTNTTGSLFIGGSNGLYDLNGGDLIVQGGQGTIIGTFGYGEFNQRGGTHTTDTLSLGQSSGSSARYTLTYGDLIVNGQMIVGHGDTSYSNGLNGLFTQSGGYVEANEIIIGGFFDYSDPSNPISKYGTGRYELSGDGIVWSRNSTTVGNTSQGSVLQTGGRFIAGTLTLGSSGLFSVPGGPDGFNYYSKGSYDLQGGHLESNGTTVAAFGLGTFSQSGGTHMVHGDLVIGDGPAAIEPLSGQVREGIYSLSGNVDSSVLTVNGNTVIGKGNSGFPGEPGGKGTFTQSGGTHTIHGHLIIGQGSSGTASAGGNGTYTLSDGVLSVNPLSNVYETQVGGDGTPGLGGTGTFTQTGGVFTTPTLVIGGANGNGTYNLSGTGVTTSRRTTYVGGGSGAQGTVNQSGGTLNAGFSLYVGYNGGHGTYNMSGGALSATAVFNNDTFNYSGGAINAVFTNNAGATTTVISPNPLTITGSIANAGIFNVNAPLTITSGFTQTAGTLSGAGTIIGDVRINGGTVAPGNSPGVLTVDGNYTQTGGTLAIELGSSAYDSLHITGSAAIAGTLKVNLYNGYTPVVGSYFDILLANGITGTFTGLDVPAGWAWNVDYLDANNDSMNDTVRLSANAVPIPGALWLFGPALAGLVGLRRRFMK
jgi:hypothetical protein